MLSKLQKIVAVVLVVFAIFASFTITQCYQSSMTIGFMGNAEMVQTLNVRFMVGNDVQPDQMKVALQNQGYGSVTITNGFLNNTQAINISPQPPSIEVGYSSIITLTFKPHTFVDGSQYQIRLMTAKGSAIISYQAFDSAYSTQHNYDEPLPTLLPTRAQIETENRISLTIIASIIISFVVTSGLIIYSKSIHKRKRVYETQEQTVYINRIGQALSSLCIGFGFVFFCFSILFGLMSIASLIISITPLILAATLILKERSKKLFSVRKIAIGFVSGVLGFLFLRFIPGFQFVLIFLFNSPDFMTMLLVGCGFFSVGLVGVYFSRKAKSLALLFLLLAVLFLSFVPVAAFFKEENYFEFYVPISQRYPIQLSLAGIAFLLWGTLSALFARFYSSSTLSSTLRSDETTKTELDRTSNTGHKPVFNKTILIGFLLLIIAPIGFIGAAYIYQPQYFFTDSFFGSYATLSIILVSITAGLLIFGAALIIYQKSKLLIGLVAAGSLVLVAATLAYIYQAPITSLIFGYIRSISYDTIYRVYALPLFFTSIVFYAVGIILMLKARASKGTSRSF
jgi:hypothetical protein